MDQSLFFFILSSAKSIPQIQSVGEAVFQRFGEDLGEGIYSFPGWDRLSEIPEADLRLIKLGYRAKCFPDGPIYKKPVRLARVYSS